MTSDLRIDADELGNFVDALRYTLALATHWGQLNIPAEEQVLIAGFTFEDDGVAGQGTALALPREESSDSQIVITDCAFEECTVAGAADLLIDLAHGAVRSE